MPPTQTEEGIQAAHELRRRHPGMGIVLLSQHVEVGVATPAAGRGPQRLGYLIKDRVSDPADFAGSLRLVADGGTALDPQVVSALLSRSEGSGPAPLVVAARARGARAGRRGPLQPGDQPSSSPSPRAPCRST